MRDLHHQPAVVALIAEFELAGERVVAEREMGQDHAAEAESSELGDRAAVAQQLGARAPQPPVRTFALQRAESLEVRSKSS